MWRWGWYPMHRVQKACLRKREKEKYACPDPKTPPLKRGLGHIPPSSFSTNKSQSKKNKV